jgi:nitroreductase
MDNLQEAIASRRSIKKFKHDMTIDDDKLYQAIEKAADHHLLSYHV